MSLRVVFMGTPEFAVPVLSEILGAGHEVVAAYTQPARPAGRGMAERPSPVQAFAEAQAIPVATPGTLRNGAEQQAFTARQADVAVVVAYGLILPKAVLDAPREGCLNLHASLLPRWRGAAPIQRAIMAGDTATAVTVMRMEEGLDTGPMCLVERVAIPPRMTSGELHDELSRIGASLMIRALAAVERGTLRCEPQPGLGVTYAPKIDKAEARIDFSRPAHVVYNLVRGLSPHPGAWFEAGPPKGRERIKVLRSEPAEGQGTPGKVLDGALTIACGEDAVRLTLVQRAGKRPVAAEEFLRGFPLRCGSIV